MKNLIKSFSLVYYLQNSKDSNCILVYPVNVFANARVDTGVLRAGTVGIFDGPRNDSGKFSVDNEWTTGVSLKAHQYLIKTQLIKNLKFLMILTLHCPLLVVGS